MWIADQWQDYELLDCGGGEKLERWDKQYLVRPDISDLRPAADTGRKKHCRKAGKFTTMS